MTKTRNGMPVPRHQLLLLEDGNPAVMWTDDRIQELQSGAFRAPGDTAPRSRPLLDDELRELASLGIIEDFDARYVWLTAMHQARQSAEDAEARTLAEHAARRVFFVYTTMTEDAAEDVRARLQNSPLRHDVEVVPLNGLTAVVGRAGKPFDTLKEAEDVLQILLRLGEQFADAAVVFQDGRDGRKATNELVAAVLNEPEAELSFDELAASQTATPETAGKAAVLIVQDAHYQRVVDEALADLGISPFVVQSSADVRQALDIRPALIICDMGAAEYAGWQWLVDLMAADGPGFPVLMLANPGEFDPEIALALKTAGVHFLIDFPLSASRLRLHIYEVLHRPPG
jgi:hypothetical protein